MQGIQAIFAGLPGALLGWAERAQRAQHM